MQGYFISFEGPDGSGKSTQIKLVKEYFQEKGFDLVITREPGGTRISEKIREIILDNTHIEMDYMTEALLYAASRAQHVSQIIIPALREGKVVICDRFVDSSIVYQGIGRGLGRCVKVINDMAIKDCMPDITFLFKITPEEGKKRIQSEDRLEMEELDYHKKVYNGYLELEKEYPDRIKGIDASRTIEEIHKEIKGYLERLLAECMLRKEKEDVAE